MCIKSAPFLHQIWCIDALLLMLLTKFVQHSTIRRCSFCINFLNFDSKLSPNLVQICPISIIKSTLSAPLQKFDALKRLKGIGTKMHKYLVGKPLYDVFFIFYCSMLNIEVSLVKKIGIHKIFLNHYASFVILFTIH